MYHLFLLKVTFSEILVGLTSFICKSYYPIYFQRWTILCYSSHVVVKTLVGQFLWIGLD